MKKSDLQVYFHTLRKRFGNMLYDPEVQRLDYQILADNALVVLERIVDEGLDNEEKAETEQQKNCLYCHGGENHKALYIKDNKARKIVLNLKNDKHHPHSIAVWYKDFTVGDDYEPGGWIVKNVPLKYWASINYCPMCGRRLGSDDD